jgi:hypothetical protein
MGDYTVHIDSLVCQCTLTHPNDQVWDFLDLQADVGEDENSEISDEELGECLEKVTYHMD